MPWSKHHIIHKSPKSVPHSVLRALLVYTRYHRESDTLMDTVGMLLEMMPMADFIYIFMGTEKLPGESGRKKYYIFFYSRSPTSSQLRPIENTIMRYCKPVFSKNPY